MRDAAPTSIELRDGSHALIRPLVEQDEDAYRMFFDRLSPESKYYRFFSPKPRLTDREVEHFIHLDHVHREALVIAFGDEIVGVGRYDEQDGHRAEVAFVVDDAHQHLGGATLLLYRLAELAAERGIVEFHARVLPDNHPMLDVFRHAGYPVTSTFEDGEIVVTFPITDSGRPPLPGPGASTDDR